MAKHVFQNPVHPLSLAISLWVERGELKLLSANKPADMRHDVSKARVSVRHNVLWHTCQAVIPPLCKPKTKTSQNPVHPLSLAISLWVERGGLKFLPGH